MTWTEAKTTHPQYYWARRPNRKNPVLKAHPTEASKLAFAGVSEYRGMKKTPPFHYFAISPVGLEVRHRRPKS